MEKYLHKYTSAKDFNDDYNGVGEVTTEVTAITVNSAEILQSCNDWDNAVETHDYDGTYVFDREEEITNATDCEGNPVDWFTRVKVFKNGNKEIYAPYSNDVEKWSYEDGFVGIYQDFSSIYQAGDGDSDNFIVKHGEKHSEGSYHEPWVSLTVEGNRRRLDYNKRIWMDLSSYAYPVYGSPVSLSTVSEPKPSNRGKVYVKEPDGQTYPYNYNKEADRTVVLLRQYPDGSGYTIVISPDGTAQWYYNRGKS